MLQKMFERDPKKPKRSFEENLKLFKEMGERLKKNPNSPKSKKCLNVLNGTLIKSVMLDKKALD